MPTHAKGDLGLRYKNRKLFTHSKRQKIWKKIPIPNGAIHHVDYSILNFKPSLMGGASIART